MSTAIHPKWANLIDILKLKSEDNNEKPAEKNSDPETETKNGRKERTFCDMAHLLMSNKAVRQIVESLEEAAVLTVTGNCGFYLEECVDVVICVEGYGLALGTTLAFQNNLPLSIVRRTSQTLLKSGTIFATPIGVEGYYEIHKHLFSPGARCLIIDDGNILSGALESVIRMTEMAGGNVVGIVTLVEIPEHNHRRVLESQGYKYGTVATYQPETGQIFAFDWATWLAKQEEAAEKACAAEQESQTATDEVAANPTAE